MVFRKSPFLFALLHILASTSRHVCAFVPTWVLVQDIARRYTIPWGERHRSPFSSDVSLYTSYTPSHSERSYAPRKMPRGRNGVFFLLQNKPVGRPLVCCVALLVIPESLRCISRTDVVCPRSGARDQNALRIMDFGRSLRKCVCVCVFGNRLQSPTFPAKKRHGLAEGGMWIMI